MTAYVVAPHDIVVARSFSWDDRIAWLLSSGRFELALTLASRHTASLSRHTPLAIAEQYAASLLEVEGRVAVDPDVVCDTVTPTDALANEVPLSYSAPEGTVAFTGVSEGEVVTAPVDGDDLPVAIHRFVSP